jgi:hypothetical protein
MKSSNDQPQAPSANGVASNMLTVTSATGYAPVFSSHRARGTPMTRQRLLSIIDSALDLVSDEDVSVIGSGNDEHKDSTLAGTPNSAPKGQ